MRRAIVLSLLVASAACARAPQVRPPAIDVEAPAAWGTPVATDAPPDAWWTSFGDDRLSVLVETALEENRDLEAAAQRVEQALAQARIAGAPLKPAIGAGVNAQRSRQNFVGFPIPGGGVLSTTSTRYQLGLDASWEVDLWGRLRAGARASLAQAQAAEADLAAARLSIGGLTAKLWFGIGEAREQLELARETVQALSRTEQLVRNRYESGVRPSIDLRLTLSARYEAEGLISLWETALEQQERQLEVLLGRYPSATLLDEGSLDELPPLPRPVPAGLPSELVARRPDLVASERRLAAADQQRLVARRARYPRLSLTASGGTVSDQLGDLVDGDFRVWSFVGNLVAPLFQGGRLRAGVDLADAVGDEALALYASRVLQAYAEVETALANEGRLRARAGSLADSVEQLEGAHRLAEARYVSGVGDYLTVLEARTRTLSARSEWIRVRRDLLTNRVDLHLALGGGFAAPATEEDIEP